MNISNVFSLLGGIALFLFGMNLMGDGLKHAAGNKLELVLYRLSGTHIKGVLLGTAVTAVIQSSAATSVMVTGFVNSAIMTLDQAISVILGSILGTSITGWIIALSELENAGGWLSLVSTATLTAAVAVAGIIMRMTAKGSKKLHISSILLGFAVLMYGISAMSGAVAPLKESPIFASVMLRLSNPLLGLLAGIALAAVLQSASSATGLLQTLSVTGAVSFSAAFPILLGINVGASVPVLLSSVGAKADAKRASYSYLLLSLFGSLAAGALFYLLKSFLSFAFFGSALDSFGIALVNSIFRLSSVILLFPFIGLLEKQLNRFVKDDIAEEGSVIPPLEERFLSNPVVALKHCYDAVASMAGVVSRNLFGSINLIGNFSEEGFKLSQQREDIADRYEDKLGAYLVKLAGKGLNAGQSAEASKYLHGIGDFERISDHALNIAECASEIAEKKIEFSAEGAEELEVLLAALKEVVELSFRSFLENNPSEAKRVEPLEELIDNLCDEIKLHHVERLKSGDCTIEHGFVFNDLLTNIERVSDHASNIALAVIEFNSKAFDAHEYINSLKELNEESFAKYYDEYSNKYFLKKN